MRFKRISTDTVRCIVTQEELNENGLEMDDFMSNKGKTEEFLRRMLSIAEQEVGFRIQGGPLTIQVAALGDNRLALTFSEKQPDDYSNLLECLRSAMSSLSEAVNEKAKKQKEQADVTPAPAGKRKDNYLLEFGSMDTLRTFCMGLESDMEEQLQMDSELYYLADEGVYDLIIHRGELDEKQLCRIVSSSMEFLNEASVHEGQIAYIREHGKCMRADHAISQLQRVFRH